MENVDFDEESNMVVFPVRPRKVTKRRRGRCGTRSPGYDPGEGRHNWAGATSGLFAASSRPIRRG